MQAGDVKLGSILSDNHRYVIPMFQRPYVWNADRNWLPLWNDIADAADTVVTDMTREEWPQEPPTYFLGAFVVKSIPSHPQRLGGSMLVDGQQRLTTLQVMLAAARAVAAELGAHSAAGRFDEWVENSSKAVHQKHPDDRYKLWPLPQDREQYKWAVRKAGDLSTCPDPEHRICQARIWFEGTIRQWSLRGGDPGDRLDALHSALEKRIALVRITLERTDNAQVIFEALNHRGVELSQSDLIKNLLFRLVEDSGDPLLAESLLNDHWLPLDGQRWRSETVTGRIRRSLLDQVVTYWLTGRRAEVVSVERLFDEFKSWLLDGDFSAPDLIKEIRTHADLYDSLVENPTDHSIAALIDLVVATKTSTVWPLILTVYGDDRISDAQRRKSASAVYSYLARRMLCGLTSKDYNRIFVAVLRTAQATANAGGLVGDAVEKELGSLVGDSRHWPDDGAFMAAIFGSNFYALTKPRQRVFFAGLENYLRDDKSDQNNLIRAQWEHLNIEHVMPQSWKDHWPLDDDTSELRARREQCINSVGNLTLTNGRLNSQMRNKAWPLKRVALQGKSTMLITTASILSAPPGVTTAQSAEWDSKWEETRISTRGAYLTGLALTVWPRPDITPAVDDDELDDDAISKDAES